METNLFTCSDIDLARSGREVSLCVNLLCGEESDAKETLGARSVLEFEVLAIARVYVPDLAADSPDTNLRKKSIGLEWPESCLPSCSTTVQSASPGLALGARACTRFCACVAMLFLIPDCILHFQPYILEARFIQPFQPNLTSTVRIELHHASRLKYAMRLAANLPRPFIR